MNKKIVILTSLTHILKKLYKQCGTRTADDEIFEKQKVFILSFKDYQKMSNSEKAIPFF